eukprot:m.122415 g.122415  ORF g.122415 m.122415 type:complete len:756 (-) comp21952_c0_seq1:32-2299(-)
MVDIEGQSAADPAADPASAVESAEPDPADPADPVLPDTGVSDDIKGDATDEVDATKGGDATEDDEEKHINEAPNISQDTQPPDSEGDAGDEADDDAGETGTVKAEDGPVPSDLDAVNGLVEASGVGDAELADAESDSVVLAGSPEAVAAAALDGTEERDSLGGRVVEADSVTAGAPWEAQSSPSTPNNGSGSASDAQTTEDASRSGADDSGGAAQAEGTEGDLDEIDEEQDNEEPYPRTNDDDLGGTTIGTSPQSDLAADDVFDDPYSTDVDEDALSELPDGGFLRGILKAAGASSSPEGSVSSASVSCDESSKGVRFTLPDGHVDAPERAPVDKYHVRSTPMDAAGMTLQELINRYSKACELLEVDPMKHVLQPLQNMLARGEDGLPTILDLRGVNRLDHRHVRIICDYMCHNNKLRDLNMTGIPLKDADLDLLQQAVFQRRRSLSRLNFSGNSRIGRAGYASIGKMISKSVFLSYLNVSGCPFTVRTAEAFKEAIASCKLKTLIMHCCNLKVAKCLKPIVAGLLVCSHISEVSMKSNDIPASSAHILLGLLQQECVVETLDLRSNKLGNAGVTTLATKLSRNRRIVKLVLFDNGISKDGGIALFMALRSNNTLSSLDLSQNEIGLPETLEHLKRLLICNSTIENLFLWNVGIQDHGAIILGEGVAENESLKRLELRNNSLSAIGLMALSHGIKVNAIVYKVLLDVPDEPDKSKQELALSAYQGIQHHCGQNLVKSGIKEPHSMMSRFSQCGQR